MKKICYISLVIFILLFFVPKYSYAINIVYDNVELKTILIIVVPLILLIISICLWYKNGKDDNIIEEKVTEPPEGYNSLEIAYLCNGKVKEEDVVLLLLHLANKGYIKIKRTYEKALFKEKNTFEIIKQKEYLENNYYEEKFMNALFKEGEKSVNLINLNRNIYNKFNQILDNLNDEDNYNKMFNKGKTSNKVFIIIFIIVSLLTIILIPMLGYINIFEIIETLLMVLIYIPIISVAFAKDQPIVFKSFWFVFFTGIFLTAIAILPFYGIIINNCNYIIGAIIGVISIFLMIKIFKSMDRKTEKLTKILGKIKGFNSYLNEIDEEELKEIIKNNPNYFYEMLPYTYVFKISDLWVTKFNNIQLEKPDWLDSDFEIFDFKKFIDDIIYLISQEVKNNEIKGE